MLLWIDLSIQVREFDRLCCFLNPIRAAGGTEILFTIFTKTPPFKEVTQNTFPCMKRHKVNMHALNC